MCSEYKWDMKSFCDKLVSDVQVTISTPTPIVSVNKSFQLTPPHNPQVDAYRNCANCGKHVNFHQNK